MPKSKAAGDSAGALPAGALPPEVVSMVQRVLDRVQQSHQLLRDSGAHKLQNTNAKLREVSSATESAAMDIMDGVGRALEMVDRLDAEREPSDTSGELRDELFNIMNLLQFQDITTQQLEYTSSLLHELETELLEFVSGIALPEEATAPSAAEGEDPTEAIRFDPRATMHDAESRQAAADELLQARDSNAA